jgi:S1-C subfamily serine protease
MRRPWLIGLISAMFGAAATIAIQHQVDHLLRAQDPAGGSRAPLFAPPGRLPDTFAPARPALIDRFEPPAETSAGDSGDLTPEERVSIAVYEKGNRSVVHITTKSVREALLVLEVPTEGSGSGSVLDKQGHIVTNFHVVDGAQTMRVTLFNGESFDATLVGHDPVNDIAVVKVAAPPDMLHPVELGDSSRLKVGQRIYALGNPFGLERTLTTGIISSLNRSLPSKTGRTMKSIVQIDAALNRGNSGGPLLDSRGRQIGVNTAIASSTGENTGVGFAIPVDTIKRVVPQLIATGRFVRPDIGITRVHQTEGGLVIATLSSGGPAERAGLRGFRLVKEQKRRGPFVIEERRIDRSQADMIIALDGEKVSTADELLNVIERHKPSDEILVTVMRGGKAVQIPLRLAAGE